MATHFAFNITLIIPFVSQNLIKKYVHKIHITYSMKEYKYAFTLEKYLLIWNGKKLR